MTRLPVPGSGPVRGAALALALLSVLAFWPGALDRWVLPKVLVLGVAALLAFTAPPTGRLPRWLLLGIGGTVLLLVVSALVNGQPVAALLGRWPRYEGLVTATGYLLALVVGARLLGPTAGDRMPRLLDRVLAASAGLLALVSVLEAAGLRPLPSDLARPGALLGNATDQGAVAAAFAVVLLARVLTLAHGPVERVLLGAASAVAALTVLLSGSRAALVALVAGVIAAVALSAVSRRARLALGSAAVAVVTGLALAIPAMGSRLIDAGGSVTDRLLIWRETLEVVAAHPALGVGPSGFLDRVAAVHGVDWFTSTGDGTVLDSPHDLALQALVVGGPLALLGLLVAGVALVRALVRQHGAAESQRRGVIMPAALGAGVLVLVLLTHVTAPATVLLAALLLGAAVAIDPRLAPESVARRIAVGVPTAAWLVLVTLTLAAETAVATGVDHAAAGRIDEASGAFGTASTLRPWDRDTPLIAAEALTARVDSGDTAALEAANQWASRALDAAPGSLAAGKSAVTIALARGDLEHAEQLLDDLRAGYPADPWVAHRAGAVALGLGDAAQAEQLLLEATRLDPDRAEPWLTLAYLYESLGDDAAAAAAQAEAEARG